MKVVAAEKKPPKANPFDALKSLKTKLAQEESAAKAKKGPSSSPAPAPRPKTPPPAKVTASTPEDEALQFHRLFGGVQPLDRSRGRVPKSRGERSEGAVAAPAQAAADARAEVDAVHRRLSELAEGARFEVSDDGRHVEGRRTDLPLDMLRRLRRGLQPIDARIDLHGMGVELARVELESFLGVTRARGERCVLVIHGKGEHSPHGVGVLRGEMSAWLSQGPSSRHIAAFASANERDGGDGAVYVLLRR